MARTAFRALLVSASLANLVACSEHTEPRDMSRVSAKANEKAIPDPEMVRKMAEAKAAYDKLTPREKAKLAEASAKVSNTLPMPLTEAGSIKLRPHGKPEITLASVAPTGTPTIIAAWASWCVPCKVEARELARMRRQHSPDKLNIVYVNVGDPKVEATKGPEFLRTVGAEQLGLTMLDREGFFELTRVDQLSVPRVLVYDRIGNPTTVISGAIGDGPDPRLMRAVQKVLG